MAVLAALLLAAVATPGLAVDSPTVQLSSSFFLGSGESPANRNALALVLDAHSAPEAGSLAYGVSFGWIRLYQPGGGGLATSHVSNALMWGSYRFELVPTLDLDAGLGLSLGLTATDPSPQRRLLRTALGHGIAMQGVYDAWLWAPGRGGFVLPVRLQNRHRLRGWQGAAQLEGAFLFTLPSSETGERDLGRVVQTAAEYAVLPRRWLAAGSRLQLVWMPGAELWKSQWSVVPFLAVVRGRWRIAGDLLLNLDEPYGFAGNGQRIWAASLKVGAWL